MKRVSVFAGLVVVFALGGLSNAAENATKAEGLELYPNFQTLSVYAFYSGDENANNSTRMEYREAGGQWREGHPLTRIYGNQWTGSVFWLKSATEYEVRVTLADPDGVNRGVSTATVKTRDDRWPVGSGKSIYVMEGGTGDGSQAAPLGNIQKAVDMASAGDTVIVGAGIYREEVTVTKSGTPDAYILIRGERGAVLDGSDPGFLDRLAAYRWTSATIDGKTNPYDFVTAWPGDVSYVEIDDEKLYGYGGLEEMAACMSGPPGGWYQDKEAGRLYIHTTVAYGSPDNRKTVVSAPRTGITLRGKYVVVDGLEVRYFGKYGIDVKASENVIQNCLVHHQDSGINIYDKNVHNTTIQDNEVSQTSVYKWPWYVTKGTRYEVDNIGARAGRGTVVRRNVIHGSFDGVGLSVWEAREDPGWMQDTDINDNHIYDCGDDGCEPEGTCTNLRFWNNRIHDCLMVMSIAPVTVGPTYFVNETYWNGRLGILKIKVQTSGIVKLYNCTFYASGYRQSVWDYGGGWRNLTFRNCIFRGSDYVFSDTGPSKEGTVSFDYDALYTTLPGKFVRWERKTYGSLAEFQAAGYEEHGLSVDPGFIDEGNADFRLRVDSPLVDRGVHIPGINDGFLGAAPDIGAHEAR